VKQLTPPNSYDYTGATNTNNQPPTSTNHQTANSPKQPQTKTLNKPSTGIQTFSRLWSISSNIIASTAISSAGIIISLQK
jgi:hypothetical protein